MIEEIIEASHCIIIHENIVSHSTGDTKVTEVNYMDWRIGMNRRTSPNSDALQDPCESSQLREGITLKTTATVTRICKMTLPRRIDRLKLMYTVVLVVLKCHKYPSLQCIAIFSFFSLHKSLPSPKIRRKII